MKKYDDLSIRELQAEAKRRDVPTSRVKEELVQRLQEVEAVSVEIPQVEIAPDTKTWRDGKNIVVSFKYDGPLTDSQHKTFIEQAEALVRQDGYQVITGPVLTLNQGARVQYVVEVTQ